LIRGDVRIDNEKVVFYPLRSSRLQWKAAQAPTLSTVNYVSGRVALRQDGKRGYASFVATPGVTRPSSVHIPQYAIYAGETHQHRPVILVQAEELINGSATMVGFIDLSQEVGLSPLGFSTCTLQELRLLGAEDPREWPRKD